VTAVVERSVRLVRLEVEGTPCVAYPRLTGPVALGDDVVVNTQARELGLGSGGFDVLYANLTRGLRLAPEPGAHVMKLPYTPLQHAASHVEEGEAVADRLDGLPVVCCTLHSQLVPAVAGLGRGRRVAYAQLEGGALPVSLSDAVRALRREGFLAGTVAVGACVDGERACSSVAAALGWAKAGGFDAVVCAIGPGIVGTGSPLGHGALSAVEAIDATHAMGGVAVLAPRVSAAEARERHRPVSHHTLAVLALALGDVSLAWPEGLPVPEGLPAVVPVDVTGWQEACAGLPLETMGRGPEEDPWFFAAAFAAGKLAAESVAA
jgi:hypothetical protein